MIIDYISDLHLEINGSAEHRIKKDPGGDILILAGDITCMRFFNPKRTDPEARGMKKRFKSILTNNFGDYEYIFYIPGNHEYYGHYYWGADQDFREIIEGYDDRLRFVNNSATIVPDKKTGTSVFFIFSIFWSNFRNGNPLDMNAAESGMNDYRSIYQYKDADINYINSKSPNFNNNKLCAQITLEEHRRAFSYIKNAYEWRQPADKVVVVTHHAPSFKSHNNSRLSNLDALSSAFYSEYFDWIAESNISYWIHGHTHHDVDYDIGGTNIRGCMYGYDGFEFGPQHRPKQIGRIEC